MAPSWSTPPAEASDSELIARTRAGSDDAYAELFTRHRGIALGVARRVAGPDQADDLVADAFLKLLAVLRAGGGPDDAFRSYLLTTVRNLHLNKVRATRRESLVPDYEDVERHLVLEDGVDDLLDEHAVGRAFAALPERWQTVLWLGAVEGRSNAEIAGMLDLKPNAVAALSFRARDGLREAYLADHLLAAQDPRCRRITDLLPAYVRGSLTPPRQSLVVAHLDGCARCAGLAAELSLVEANLAAYLAPLLFVPLLGTAAVGSGASAGALGWFTKLGTVGKAAVLTATVGPVLATTVVTGIALRGEEAPPGQERSAPLVTGRDPASEPPVRRRVPTVPEPAVDGPAPDAGQAVPLAAPGDAEPDDTSAAPGPTSAPTPAPTSAPTSAPDPAATSALPVTQPVTEPVTEPVTAPSPRSLFRRLVDGFLRIVQPVVDATAETAGLLTGTDPDRTS